MTKSQLTALQRRGITALGTLAALALAATASLAICLPAYAAEAQTFAQDGFSYTVTGQSTVRVGAGTNGDGVDTSVTGTDVVIPESVDHDGTTYQVTEVGPYAFSRHTELDSVTLPASITRLDEYAFAYCGTMDESKDPVTFDGLSALVIPENTQLAYIGNSCFYQDFALADFVIPATVTTVASYSFYDCTSFKQLRFQEGTAIQELSPYSFELSWKNKQVRPSKWANDESFTWFDQEFVDWDWETGMKASPDYGGLESVVLPASLRTTGVRCFCNQRNLKDVTFEGSTIDSLGNYTFAFCASLEEITLPDAGCKDPGTYTWRTAYGAYTFIENINLTKITFGRNKSGLGRWNTLRMFDGCKRLSTVVYRYNRFIPTAFWTSSGFDGTSVDGRSLYSFNSSKPTLYHTIYFCPSGKGLSREAGTLGTAVIREGVKVGQITSGLAAADEKGAVILEGSIPALPEGYDSWALTTCKKQVDLQVETAIEAPCYAYPVKQTDLSRGSAVLSGTAFWYSQTPHKPQVTVVSSTGKTLTENADYTLSWERMTSQPEPSTPNKTDRDWDPNDPNDPRNDDDPDNDDESSQTEATWEPTTDFTSAGTLRVVATAAKGSSFEGSTAATFQIAYLEVGETFTYEGVTYQVTKAQGADTPAEVQVGNGEEPAVKKETEGTVAIPSAICLDDSTIPVKVTGIAMLAFGSNDEANACANIEEVVLPSSLTSIGSYAFANMASLRSVTLPASLKSIGSSAFEGSTLLSSVVFKGASVETIGSKAFCSCASLKSIALPAITESLQGLAFKDCVNLKSVTFNGSVAGNPKLGQFSGCTRLETVDYLGGWWEYPYGSYPAITCLAGSGSSKALYAITSSVSKTVTFVTCKYTGKVATVPATVKIGSDTYKVTKIGSKAFAGTSVTSVSVKSTATSGFSTAFSGSKVASVSCPGGAKSTQATYVINSLSKKTVTYATCGFSGKTVSVPATVKLGGVTYKVTKVGGSAFAKAKATTVKASSKTITSFAKAFTGSKVKTVKVPPSKRKAYAKLLTKSRCGKKVAVK